MQRTPVRARSEHACRRSVPQQYAFAHVVAPHELIVTPERASLRESGLDEPVMQMLEEWIGSSWPIDTMSMTVLNSHLELLKLAKARGTVARACRAPARPDRPLTHGPAATEHTQPLGQRPKANVGQALTQKCFGAGRPAPCTASASWHASASG